MSKVNDQIVKLCRAKRVIKLPAETQEEVIRSFLAYSELVDGVVLAKKGKLDEDEIDTLITKFLESK